MDAATRVMVLAIVRHGKGILAAVEKWVQDSAVVECKASCGHVDGSAASAAAPVGHTSPPQSGSV